MAITRLKAYDEFVEFITSQPTLEQIIEFFLSDEAQSRLEDLLHNNQQQKLSSAEDEELQEYLRLEFIIQQAKVRALEKLSLQP